MFSGSTVVHAGAFGGRMPAEEKHQFRGRYDIESAAVASEKRLVPRCDTTRQSLRQSRIAKRPANLHNPSLKRFFSFLQQPNQQQRRGRSWKRDPA